MRIEGEPVSLSPDIATPFGLVLHELAINAFKHGSLSRPRDSVGLSWSVSLRNGERVLKFIWQEQGGATTRRPSTSGLGTSLIENAIPHAAVRREFGSQGLTCTIEVPLQAEKDGSAASS